MKRFLSLYHPQYPRALVYMLQASEYSFIDFWRWFLKVPDFTKVEQRKNLEFTLKAKLLLLVSYLNYIFHLVAILTLLFTEGSLWAIGYFVVWPYAVLFKVVAVNFILKVVQGPIEQSIVNKAKKTLSTHGAIKIGIAGSFGKTTMKETLKTVLSQKFKVEATPSNKNTPLGIARFAQQLKGDEEVLIFEMGEYYPHDIERLCEIVEPSIGIITGVNEAHLEKFKTVDVAGDTVFELADFLRGKQGSKVYVNAESRVAKEKSAKYRSILYGAFGIESEEGNFRAESAETGLEGVSFVLKNNENENVVVNSSLLGLHQVGPLSAVAHVARTLGMKTEEVEMGLKQTKAFEHRLEPKMDTGGVVVIDDSYNGNPDGARVAIEFLSQIKNKRRFYITPGLVEMGEKTKEVHKEIGRLLALAQIEKVVLVRNSATPYIEAGLKDHNYSGEIIWFEDAATLFRTLPKMTVSNDLLLYQNDWPDNYS